METKPGSEALFINGAPTIPWKLPTATCSNGHTSPLVHIVVDDGTAQLAKVPYCAICWAEWMGKMFPVNPTEETP